MLTYTDLDMSRVDAQLSERGELALLLDPNRARLLITMIESARGVSHRSGTRPSRGKRLALAIHGAFAAFWAAFFHRRLLALSRALVYFSAHASWTSRADGRFEFRFLR